MSLPRRASLMFILFLVSVASPDIRPSSLASRGDEQDPWTAMLDYLQVMHTGDPAQKRRAADDTYERLAPLFEEHQDRDQDEIQALLDEVHDIVRLEKDDFVSWTMLHDLAIRFDERLAPIFLDALRDASPNLQWSGIKWFRWNPGPEAVEDLQFAWRHEERHWVRSDLIAALAEHGCYEHVEEFASIAQGNDPVLAEAAIGALSRLKDVRGLPAVVRLARSGDVPLRRAALDALASWPDSPDALDALLLGIRSEDPSLKADAIRSLGSFSDPKAVDRLEEVGLKDAVPWFRSLALESLGSADPARAIPILVDVLHEPSSDDSAHFKAAAARALMDIDDTAILDAVSDLDPAALGSDFEMMLESLGRDRERSAKTVFMATGCSFPTVIVDPANPAMCAITPPPWLRSIRCWETPDFAGDPADFRRIRAGTPVRIENRFESADRSWAQVRTVAYKECWVPIEYVTHPSVPAEVGVGEADMMRREFDLPAIEVESDVARGLMDAGLLEVIEPGDEVIGVAITLDPDDFDSVLLLARSCGLNETMLDGEIYAIVTDVAPLYRGRPVLDRFRRTPQPAPGETDDLIDLDIEELSDR